MKPLSWPGIIVFNMVLILVILAVWVRYSAVVLAAAQLFPSAACGQPGETVVVVGEGFSPNALVSVTWSGMALGTEPAPVQVDPAGRLNFSFVVPNDQAGPHTVLVADDTSSAQFLFDLGAGCPTPTATTTPSQPTPTPTPTSTATPPTPVAETPRLLCEPVDASPDDIIYVHGQNFRPGGPFYQLRWDGVVIPWAPEGLTVGDDGRFTLWFAAPSDTYELHTLVADDGRGGQAECYLDLIPRNPTPTWTPTPTLTPTPTMTWTPGPPPGITVTPTATPAPADYCASIEAVFTREPLAQGTVSAGIEVTNNNLAWPDGQMQLGLWQYYNLTESDTGVRANLPAMATGQVTTLPISFQAGQAGPTWFQVRLIDLSTGQVSACTSAWFPLHLQAAEPYPPPLLTPPDDTWLNTRQLSLDWLTAAVPPGAGAVESYQVHLLDLDNGSLFYQTVGPDVTGLTHALGNDYAAGRLAWRVRARNAAGWGLWASSFYFGVDTARPVVDMSIQGQVAGDNGWWRSPLTVRVGGSDPGPGSGLMATYLQPGDTRWQQVIPGGETSVDREGEIFLRAYGRDWALNRSPVLVKPVKIDRHPPHRVLVNFSREPTSSGWYTAPVTISLTAEDVVSGIAEEMVRVDDGAWQTGDLVLTANGRHTLEYMARDLAGNESEIRQTTARLDLTPPAGAIALNGSLCQTCPPITASVTAGDGDSGLGHWTLSVALPRVVTASLVTQDDTVLASGSDPAGEVTLDGGELPAGALTLRLAVQDVAGWVITRELQAVNPPYTAGPTPTPWIMATATPWPTPTPGTFPYATVTPAPADPDDDGGDGDSDNGGGSEGGGTGAGGYPVGDQVVPAILPVTGSGTLSGWLWGLPVLGLVGLAVWLAKRSHRQQNGVWFRVEQLQNWYRRSDLWAKYLADRQGVDE